MTESRKTEKTPKTHRQMTKTSKRHNRSQDCLTHRIIPTSPKHSRRPDEATRVRKMRTREYMKTRRRLKFYRKFFGKSLSILEMILTAWGNDLVRVTESLMLENGMLRFPTPPVSPEDSTSPSIFLTSYSQTSPSDARLSAFSPVSSTIVQNFI